MLFTKLAVYKLSICQDQWLTYCSQKTLEKNPWPQSVEYFKTEKLIKTTTTTAKPLLKLINNDVVLVVNKLNWLNAKCENKLINK